MPGMTGYQMITVFRAKLFIVFLSNGDWFEDDLSSLLRLKPINNFTTSMLCEGLVQIRRNSCNKKLYFWDKIARGVSSISPVDGSYSV